MVAAINRALENVPRERVRMHVCWGNYEGPHDRDVPLADILPIIREAKVGGFMFPFANPRHAHEYHCFEGRALADDQILVAGVIDTLTNFVEHPEVVAERLERVARALGDPARVLAGTDCGFDTSAGMGRVAEDVVWAKLARPSRRRPPRLEAAVLIPPLNVPVARVSRTPPESGEGSSAGVRSSGSPAARPAAPPRRSGPRP